MQVACGKCATQYEFDAAAIPAQGYDAQCTSCGNVFFVAPETPPGQISVTCQNCQAIYQFAASAIPAGGYDAQCTRCQAVFFVGGPQPMGASASASSPSISAPQPMAAMTTAT